MKKAVKSGYWNLFSFDPAKKEAGKNPFTLTSKEGDGTYQDFLHNESRYTRLGNHSLKEQKNYLLSQKK